MRKIIYVDMDDVLCAYSEALQKELARNPAIGYPQSQYGFFLNLEPIPGGIEAVKALQRHFEVYILTAPSVKNPLCYTEKRVWIEKHFGMEMVGRMIISPNKGLSKGDYLIDDHASGRGQEDFEGKLLQFGAADYPNWARVMAYFTEQYGMTNG